MSDNTSNDFFDISPVRQVVTIDTGTGPMKFTVIGIPFKIFLDLVARFPDLGKIIEGGTVDVAAIMTYGGDAVASLIAAGWGHPGDEKHEEKAASLMPEQSLDFLHGILKATMPNGLGPFKEKLDAIGAIVAVKKIGGQSVEQPATASPQSEVKPEVRRAAGNMAWETGPSGEIVLTVPRRRASDSESPKPSSSSSPTDTTNLQFGT